MDRVFTNTYDKNGKKIFEGSKLKGETFDGDIAIFVVKWSDYHKCYIADSEDEVYSVGQSIFYKYELVD